MVFCRAEKISEFERLLRKLADRSREMINLVNLFPQFPVTNYLAALESDLRLIIEHEQLHTKAIDSLQRNHGILKKYVEGPTIFFYLTPTAAIQLSQSEEQVRQKKKKKLATKKLRGFFFVHLFFLILVLDLWTWDKYLGGFRFNERNRFIYIKRHTHTHTHTKKKHKKNNICNRKTLKTAKKEKTPNEKFPERKKVKLFPNPPPPPPPTKNAFFFDRKIFRHFFFGGWQSRFFPVCGAFVDKIGSSQWRYFQCAYFVGARSN